MAVQPSLTVDWVINLPVDQANKIDICQLESVVHRALAGELEQDADLAIVFAGDAELRQLNARYRDIDEVTDVLSFPQRGGEVAFVAAPDGIMHLGDVVISVPQAERQAATLGRSLDSELALLVAHGALHLVGYDHAGPEQEARMQARERAALGAQ